MKEYTRQVEDAARGWAMNFYEMGETNLDWLAKEVNFQYGVDMETARKWINSEIRYHLRREEIRRNRGY